jgi:hypothetical protein
MMKYKNVQTANERFGAMAAIALFGSAPEVAKN